MEKVLHLQLYEYQLRPTANQPSSCKCSDSVGAEEHSAKKNTRVLDFPHDITLEARSTADIPVASSEGRPGEADTLATSTSTYCHSHSRATSEDSSVPCSCPRDDATGVMCSSEKSCDGHVTDSGRGGDGEGEGGERILGLLAQEVQQVLPGAVVKTVSCNHWGVVGWGSGLCTVWVWHSIALEHARGESLHFVVAHATSMGLHINLPLII